jgi:Right handed beta helix region
MMKFTLGLFWVMLPVSLVAEVTVRVSPGGPIGSLRAARDEVRKVRVAQPGEAVRVEFASGDYALTEPVVFSAEDSGADGARVLYTNAPGAVVVVSGGVAVTDWKPDGGNLWSAPLPEGAARQQLWINGRRATLARTPDQGYFNMAGPASGAVFPGVTEDLNHRSFTVRPNDFKVLMDIPSAEKPGAILTAMHTWSMSLCRLEALHAASHSVLIRGKSWAPFAESESYQRWYLENTRAALNAPGEWYADRVAGRLLYIPLAGEDMTKAKVMAPVSSQFMTMQGAHHLSFLGLHFKHTQYDIGPDGYHDIQAAAPVGGTIEMEDCSEIHFRDCRVAHTGLHAIFFKNGCHDSSVRHCYLNDLGGSAVRIGDSARPDEGAIDDTRVSSRITVDDCIFHSGGRSLTSACGVLLTFGSDCVVTHNEIADFYYTGISSGWSWGYNTSPSKRNQYNYNHIHHLGWGVLSDMGGIYNLGRSEGNSYNNNYIHHVAGFRYGGWGLYTDEGSTGVSMEYNIVHDTTQAGFHQHYGKWNRVCNNIFAFGKNAQMQRSRGEAHAGFSFERNIIYYSGPNLLDGGWANWEGNSEMLGNCYYRTGGQPVTFVDTDLAGWQQRLGKDLNSIVADPLFVDAEKRDFRLKPESPALKLGFAQLDASSAGVRKADAAWRTKAASLVLPDWETHSQPWPAPDYSSDEGYEFLQLGMPKVPWGEIVWANQGDNISVTDTAARSGKQSLKFQDAAGLKNSWEPLLTIKPYYRGNSTVTCRFALRAEAGVVFIHEWRNDAYPYQTGPSLVLRDGQLTASGKTLCALAPDTWADIEITAATGENAGTWEVTITPVGGTPVEAKNLLCQPGWKALDWLGFVSDTEAAKAFFLDDLKVFRSK